MFNWRKSNIIVIVNVFCVVVLSWCKSNIAQVTYNHACMCYFWVNY